MAIYISGVKGLPEQVQENKENIKAIQEEIEGIDFEEIRELEAQVEENTQDINNLEGSVGVQNIAISDHEERLDTLEPKVSALETKTSQIAYDEDNDSTNIGTSVKIYGNGKIEARQLDALDTHYKDAEISNGESGIYLVQDGLTAVRIFNSHSGTTHTLDFNDDGSLEVDGQAVGKTYYEHNICLSYDSSSNAWTHIFIQIENDDPTPFTAQTLINYLYDKGFTTNKKSHVASGWFNKLSSAYIVSGLYAVNKNYDNQSLHVVGISTTSFDVNSNIQDTNIPYSYIGTITDFVL